MSTNYRYDGGADALYIQIRADERIDCTEELADGVLVDTAEGQLVGVDIMNPNELWNPHAIIEAFDLNALDSAFIVYLATIRTWGRSSTSTSWSRSGDASRSNEVAVTAAA